DWDRDDLRAAPIVVPKGQALKIQLRFCNGTDDEIFLNTDDDVVNLTQAESADKEYSESFPAPVWGGQVICAAPYHLLRRRQTRLKDMFIDDGGWGFSVTVPDLSSRSSDLEVTIRFLVSYFVRSTGVGRHAYLNQKVRIIYR